MTPKEWARHIVVHWGDRHNATPTLDDFRDLERRIVNAIHASTGQWEEWGSAQMQDAVKALARVKALEEALQGLLDGSPQDCTCQCCINARAVLAERRAPPSAPDSASTPDLGAPEGPATAAGAGEMERSRLEGNAGEPPNAERPTVEGAGHE